MLHTALHVAGPIAIIVLAIVCVVQSRTIAAHAGKLGQALRNLGELSEQRAEAAKSANSALDQTLRDLAGKMNEADNRWRMAEERLKKKTSELELMAQGIAEQVDRAVRLPEKIVAAVDLVGRVFRQSFAAEARETGQASPYRPDASDQPDTPESPPAPPAG